VTRTERLLLYAVAAGLVYLVLVRPRTATGGVPTVTYGPEGLPIEIPELGPLRTTRAVEVPESNLPGGPIGGVR
jgi:hypothetical protein